jgi:nucleoside-diphosphate-sugar epimerase
MKILVLGGAGYVGATLTGYMLGKGHEVTVLDRMSFGAESLLPMCESSKLRVVRGDIRDQALMEKLTPGHDAVVLLASIVGEPACNRDPEEARSINLNGTKISLEIARSSGVKHFVFASTCSNYGISNCDHLVDEEAPLLPISVYSETKVQAERNVLDASCDAMSTTVLRLSTAFGVSRRMRFDLLVSDFALHGYRDRKIVIFGEQFWRPFVHVNDIALAVDTVLQAPKKLVNGEVFNVGRNDNNLQKLQLAEMVSEALGGITIETVRRETDPRSYRVSFEKVEQKLGYRAAWTVQAGVDEVIERLENNTWADPSQPRFYN